MSAWSCQDFERVLFVHLQDKLPPAQALRVQSHLQACSACVSLSEQWGAWAATLSEQTDVPLSAQRSSRLVDAIMNDDLLSADLRSADLINEPVRHAVSLKRARLFVSAAALLAAAAAVVFVVYPRPVPNPVAPALQTLALAQPAHVGRAIISSVAASGDQSSLVRVLGEHRVIVERGPVHFEVQPLLGNDTLEACTEHTCVRVIGTAFKIIPAGASGRDRIEVEHGLVAVYARDGEGTEIVLGAGEHFEAPWSGPAPQKQLVFEAAPSHTEKAPVRFVCPRDDAAIAKLGRGSLSCLGSEDQHVAVAELLLARGDRMDAEAVFEAITRRFAGSKAAEDALYSLSLTTPDDERLERYLRIAPSGAFSLDAHWRLATSLVRAHRHHAALVHLQAVVDNTPSASRRAEAQYLKERVEEWLQK